MFCGKFGSTSRYFELIAGRSASPKVNQEKIEEEMGDLLFACSNLARHLDLNPEMALRKANRKFERRFRKVENLTKKSEGEPTTNILDKMQAYWEQVKLEEKD